tara:strand:+ start:455 stop:1318 length:864 start_codon:yes stop_codon:yes gene_type:complete
MANLKELLTEDASKYICRLQIGNLIIPYTTVDKDCSIEESSNVIKLYNIITDEIDTLEIKSIDNYTVLHRDNEIENRQTELAFFEGYKEIIWGKSTNFSNDYIYNEILNKNVVSYNLHNLLKLFNFSIKSEMIIKNTPFGVSKVDIHENFERIIQEKVDKTLLELDELLMDTVEEEDIEDISSIKEIFNDIVGDMDLTNINTFTDLTDNWPPLLLPLPDTIRNASNVNVASITNDDIDEHIQAIESIENISNTEILSSLIKILEDNKHKLTEYHYNTLFRAINVNYN